jgi:hypothetical protein
MDRWLHALAEAVRSGDYGRALDATNDFLGTARRAGAPLIERVAILDAVGQAVRSALAEGGGGTGELPQFGRLVAALRRVAVVGP